MDELMLFQAIHRACGMYSRNRKQTRGK